MNQVLSQDEINALLKGLSEGEVEQKSEDAAPEAPAEGIRQYDLSSQERIIRGRMPTLELIHDRFCRSFRLSLSKFLGKPAFVNVGGIEIIKFGAFMKKLALPSSLHVYRMPPLSGYAMMVVSTPLVFAIVDSLFGGGGSGKVKIEGREFTAIESRLIGKVVMQALDVLKDAWSPVHPVDFVYVRSEFNPLAAGIVPPTDVVIVVNIEIELEQESSSISFCTPYSTIEPLRQKLTAGFQSARLESDSGLMHRMERHIREADVNMMVELGKGKITTQALANLKAGDILQLDTSPAEQAIIKVEGVPKYKGFVGAYRGSKAVRIDSPIIKKKLIEDDDKL